MKKRLAALAMMGIVAVGGIAPVTANAAAPENPVDKATNVFYTPGATSDQNGDVMITIPQTSYFTDKQKTIDNFKLSIKVWDQGSKSYQVPGTANILDFEGNQTTDKHTAPLMKDLGYETVTATLKDTGNIWNDEGTALILKDTDTSNPSDTKIEFSYQGDTEELSKKQNKMTVGVFKDAGTEPEETAKYELGGTLTLSNTTLKKTDEGKTFGTSLMYTFTATAPK